MHKPRICKLQLSSKAVRRNSSQLHRLLKRHGLDSAAPASRYNRTWVRLSIRESNQANRRLTLTVDSGGANEFAVLNRIRFAFSQEVVAETLCATSTMNGSDVDASVTAGSATDKVQPWEISKLCQAAFLRTYPQNHKRLPFF